MQEYEVSNPLNDLPPIFCQTRCAAEKMNRQGLQNRIGCGFLQV
jgi:hypothetical protein